MHPLSVLAYMQDEKENRPFEHMTSVTPEAIPRRTNHASKPSLVPQGLFSHVIKRLGLEKELTLVKGNLKFFATLLVVFLLLSTFALIGVKHVLEESSFGPFVSLIFSDPSIVIKYWDSFMFATFESMPGITAAGLLFSLAFLILFIRLAVFALDKISIIMKSINKQKYGHK